MPFKKILISIDSEPIASHAAETGDEPARVVGAEVYEVNEAGLRKRPPCNAR